MFWFLLNIVFFLFALVIADITLFFDENHFELAIGLSLTIMLVMYTLYQSILDSLPKTAYLKLIDIWLIFCLVLPFFIFLIQIISELKKPTQPKKPKNQLEQNWVRTDPGSEIDVRQLMQYLIPILTTVCVLAYFIVSAYFCF
jgi:hypothetical protein